MASVAVFDAGAAEPGDDSVLRRLLADRFAVAGAIGIAAMVITALAAPLIARAVGHAPNAVFVEQAISSFGVPIGPSKHFLFGADLEGRDVFIRTIYGIRTALLVGFLSTALATGVGVVIGLTAGFFAGIVDLVLSRVIELFLVLPVLILILGLGAACGGPSGCLAGTIRPGLTLIWFVIGITSWAYLARVVRAQTLALRERQFVSSARLAGAGEIRILCREILPNVFPTVIVLSTVIFPMNILYETSLSFLGLGAPNQPSWGAMLGEARQEFPTTWWLMLFPSLFLLVLVLSFNVLGEGLGDVLDPRDQIKRAAEE